eukprot:m.313530 g.313530  ORF g.313530 m.313530 type:complete len:221 (-) comp20256_c1_seq19:3408-4070(-)
MSKTRTFREFLQSLKPGEIGFVIASFGATSALILTSNSIFQASKQREVAAHKEWRKVTAHVEHLVSEGTPVEGLSTIKFYQSRLREEARDLLGIEDATTDEICDEWVRRRNKGDREALEIEHVRLRLKRFWHSIESAAEYGVQHHQTINSSRSSKRYVPSEINQQGTTALFSMCWISNAAYYPPSATVPQERHSVNEFVPGLWKEKNISVKGKIGIKFTR